MDAEEANLADKRLNKLNLSWERSEQSQLQENEEQIIEVLQPHTQLKSLVIQRYLGAQLPQWMVNPTLKDLRCLKLKDCKNLFCISSLAKLPSLKHLSSLNMNHVQYIDGEPYVDGENGDNMFPRLQIVKITHCAQLNLPFLPSVTKLRVTKEWSMVLLSSIKNLPNLERICFIEDEEVTFFPDEMLEGLKYLKKLHFDRLPKLKVLPTGLANLKALEDLTIMKCDNLETITEEVLQGLCSLKRFNISGHHKFKLSTGFRHLVALEDLTIERCPEVEDFHDALQHITSLRSLRLYDLPNLASLRDWLGNPRSLELLAISECPKLMSLPLSTKSLTNLKTLYIYRCPELVKRCEEEIGEDWHKIAHVSHRVIEDKNSSFGQRQCCSSYLFRR